MRKIAIALVLSALILCTSQTALSAIPAIDLVSSGATLYKMTNSTALDFWVKVIDHDGVTPFSHVVKVYFPEPAEDEVTLEFRYNDNGNSNAAYYEGVYWLSDGETVPSGDYVFQATDRENNVGTAIDNFTPAPLEPPDQTSFMPGLWGEYITAYFDNVFVNGGTLYDDFDSGEINPGLWQASGSHGAQEIEDGRLKQSVQDTVGVGRCGLNFINDPEQINSISADITLDSISSTDNPYASAKSRISGYFFNNGVSDVYSMIQVFDNRVLCYAQQEAYENGISSYETLFNQTLLEDTIETGDVVNVSISWDEENKKLNFKAKVDGYEETATYSPSSASPPGNDYKGLESRIHLNLYDNTATFSWNPVPGAARYRIRIYDSEKIIWSGFSAEPSYRIPPGVLATNAVYYYRIDAFDAHDPLDLDNISKAPAQNDDNFRFYSSEVEPVDPYIEFDSTGVQTWNSPTGLGLVFWIKVYDAQGVPDNIDSVTVEFPGGRMENLPPSAYPSPTSAIYSSYVDALPEAGIYTFRVTDKDGHPYTVTEDLTVDSIDYPANGTMSPVPYTVLGTTEAELDWEDIPGAAYYRLEFFNDAMNRLYSFVATESHFSLAPGFLEDYAHYNWRVTTRREFYDQNVDNVSRTEYFHIATTVPFADADGDGIYDSVDTAPDDGTNDAFDDGNTYGHMLTRGDQTLTVADAPFPNKGVWITATGGSTPAIIEMCGGESQLQLGDGDEAIVTCGSVIVNVTDGTVEVVFAASDGTIATAILGAGNELGFDPDTLTFTTAETNSGPLTAVVGGMEVPIAPGNTTNVSEIDIRPFTDHNIIIRSRWGLLPVAILSSESLDAFNDVETTTVTFGKTGNEDSLAFCGQGRIDVNGDGLRDLICTFRIRDTGFEVGDTMGILKCDSKDGVHIQGSDSVRILR